MSLPIWAKALFEVSGDSERFQWQRGLVGHFERQWWQLEADSWSVPAAHECYAKGHSDDSLNPVDLVRKRILETALDLAWDLKDGKELDQLRAKTIDLEALNTQIIDDARRLASLFRRRSLLVRDHGLEDQDDYSGADPFDFWDSFESVFCYADFADFSYVNKQEIAALLLSARSQQRPKPRWPDLLEEITNRQDEVVRLTDVGDSAVAASRTNATEWSRTVLYLVGALDKGWDGTYPEGFLLGCLSYRQLTSLLEIVFRAPKDLVNEESSRGVIRRYRKRR